MTGPREPALVDPGDAPETPGGTPGGPWQRRYRVLLVLAKAAIAWERLWPGLWPAAGVAALFVSVALLDLLPMLPFWAHSLALIVFATAFGFMIRGAAAGFETVGEKTAEHRLEQDSGLDHRPLTALHDRQVTGRANSGARRLWQIHLQRMAEKASRLRVSLPSPGLARLDPYGLRAVVVLLLVIAAAAGGGEAVARLERALVPRMSAGLNGPMTLDLWITPPAYTGLAPMFLGPPKDSTKDLGGAKTASLEPGKDAAPARDSGPALVKSTVRATIRAPVGSVLLAQASGAGGAPELVIGNKVIQFAAIGGDGEGGSYRVQTVLESADTAAKALEVRVHGRQVASWPLTVASDRPPEVEFTRAPSRAGRAQLRLDYEARDDYGLAGLQVVIRHPDGLSIPGGPDSIHAELPLPGLGSRRAEGNSVKDFSAHPWAGLVVLVRLQAIDARGQAGKSDVVRTVLPERVFNHPVARAIQEVRKKLNTPDPDTVAEVISRLSDIASRPKHFFDDTVVFLALSVARSRLVHDGTPEGVGAVQELLWETALRIEDGEFAIAERDFRDAQERLMRALRNDADKDEIDRLMDELRWTLDKYLAALAEHLEKQGLGEMPFETLGRTVDSSDLQRMIEEARELARTGSIEAARQMLANLKRMLDGIRNGLQTGKPREDLARAKRMMDDLRGLTQRQSQELDKTFQRRRDAEGAMPGRTRPGGRMDQGRSGDGKRGQGNAARDQQALRRDLGRLMRRMDEFMGEIPSPFGKAERAMKGAVLSLKKGGFGKAMEQQTEALGQLRQGMEGMSERMARRMGGFGVSRGQRGGQTGPGPGNDPFGRAPGGAFGATIDDGSVKIPDRMERRRARDILDELRRRAGEHQRPAPERAYIDRLLKRF